MEWVKKKWYTITEYVERDTGEIMNKRQYERGNYIIIKIETEYETKEFGNEKRIRYIIEQSKQLRIKF